MVCDEDLTRDCLEICNGVLEDRSLVEINHPQLGGDDFAFFAQRVPAVMIRLGCWKEGAMAALHSPEFSFDEEVLEFGVLLFSYLLISLIGHYNLSALGIKQDSRRGKC